mmetsp:Transcript_175250/g.562076  ORF Transcript_175250/g.562076 Transcript_175250/m.562076 type:complete len:416 (-) Transcript_175250:66-1313(-)
MPGQAMPIARRWPTSKRGGRGLCRRPCTVIQGVSHAATIYCVTSFAALIQPAWVMGDTTTSAITSPIFVACFWIVFGITLGLYFYVCFADTKYCEDMHALNGNQEFEGRRCEDCSPIVTHTRVKHCQSCGICIEGFDHHCRYLNVCVGKHTYTPWFFFVLGLFLVMVSCFWGAEEALRVDREAYYLMEAAPYAFIVAVSLQAMMSALSSLFLISLMGQHLYFIYEGMTTLEYVKDQTPLWPGLPPYGWRDAVSSGDCFRCGEALETIEVEDTSEIWFCCICQSDIGRAGIEFFTCESCDNVHVCPVCREIARASGVLATTYRASSLRRRSEVAMGSGREATSSHVSRQASLSSQHEPRKGRSSVVVAMEGHTGDPVRWVTCCSPEAAERQGYDAGIGDDSGEGSSDEGSDDGRSS